jgi:FAD:protein FMN transferase
MLEEGPANLAIHGPFCSPELFVLKTRSPSSYAERMNRRDFLEPSRLARSAGQVWGALDTWSDSQPAEPLEAFSFLRMRHQAMATDWELIVPFGTPWAMEGADATFSRIDELEDQLSVYRSHSEVSRLNQNAGKEPVPVEPGLFELLSLAARLSEETEGAFDITAGALIKVWGFLKGPRRVPGQAELAQALACVGMEHVKLNAESRTARFLRQGLEINLGAIGKGYAIDQAVAALAERGYTSSALLHGGHSSVYAIGSEPGTDLGWLVDLGHPLEPARSLGTLRLRDCAMGTSAATFRNLEHYGRKLGHILDPRTGWPATGVQSATVIAPTATQADALATAFFIMGRKQVEAYCRRHEEVGVVLLGEGSQSPEILGKPAATFQTAESNRLPPEQARPV